MCDAPYGDSEVSESSRWYEHDMCTIISASGKRCKKPDGHGDNCHTSIGALQFLWNKDTPGVEIEPEHLRAKCFVTGQYLINRNIKIPHEYFNENLISQKDRLEKLFWAKG